MFLSVAFRVSKLLFTAGFAFSAFSSPANAQLWNINFAGKSDLNVKVVDGSNPIGIGGGVWNNIVAPTTSSVWNPSAPINILEASGGSSIGLDWGAGPSIRDVSASNANASLSNVNRGWFGFSNFDQTLEFSGLPTGMYDITVYFTWQWNENSVDYLVTQGSGTGLGRLTLVPQQSSANAYSSFIEGSNYVVFEDVSPDNGNIDLRAFNTIDGGISAIQIDAMPTLTAYVNTITGKTILQNNASSPIAFDYYLTSSASGALNPAGWQSLEDQSSNPLGANWIEAGGVNNSQLAELNLTGVSTLNPNQSIDLGHAFDPSVFGLGNNGDLRLRYGIPGQSGLGVGDVVYITAVPEPGSTVILLIAAATAGHKRRRKANK